MRTHFSPLSLSLLTLVSLLTLDAPVRAQGPAFDPTSDYEVQTLHGFTILMNRTVQAHPGVASNVVQELSVQLEKITQVVPVGPLAALKKVRIWVEWAKKPHGGAEFHPSEGWLRQNGYNPEKAGCVEISNASNFVTWSRREQPCIVLHELAHAYHHHVLGGGHAGIRHAYRAAVETKLYESVPYIHGGKTRAYAIGSTQEYFAELTEAYFGKNDFFPFTRDELKQHDPAGFALMEEAWGVKPAAVAPNPDPPEKQEHP